MQLKNNKNEKNDTFLLSLFQNMKDYGGVKSYAFKNALTIRVYSFIVRDLLSKRASSSLQQLRHHFKFKH